MSILCYFYVTDLRQKDESVTITLMNLSKPLSVSELNQSAKTLLESSFSLIQVEGEISNLARPSSGHWYFTLKDSRAQVRCAMFKNRTQFIRTLPKEGDRVVLTAKVSLYEGRGDFQLIAEQMALGGTGQLQIAFEALKAKLQFEGLFSAEHKRALPAHPTHLGIITSPTGAAIHDILHVLQRRFPGLAVTLYPTAVQGKEAAGQIVKAIEFANRDQRCDVLIVGRGGGSLEDLWPFNEEIVARAIFASRLPIVSAVGHETDITIADWVADYRAPTPSAAAEILSPNQLDIQNQLSRLARQLHQAIMLQIDSSRQSLSHLKKRLRHPGDKLRDQAQRIDRAELRLHSLTLRQLKNAQLKLEQLNKRLLKQAPLNLVQQHHRYLQQLDARHRLAMQQFMNHQHNRLKQQAALLHQVSPLATLSRGYAILQTADGLGITESNQVKLNETINARLSKGSLELSVTRIDNSLT
nr:exodeoxyribonuclease VII large subunit [Nitrincola tibetensis]